MSETSTSSMNNDNPPSTDTQTSCFARRRWSHVLALADQLRQNTALKKNEELRQLAFDIPSKDDRETIVVTSVEVQADQNESFQHKFLFAKTGNFNLDNLSENFLSLKRTFNRMLEVKKDDVKQIKLATSITKTALLMVLRSTESIVGLLTKGTRNFPTLNSLISYVRSHPTELPIDGLLLVDWYKASQALDLLMNDPDWLAQPRKAYWAMRVCNDTLTWAHAIFNQNYRIKSVKRAIFDRDDSITHPDIVERS